MSRNRHKKASKNITRIVLINVYYIKYIKQLRISILLIMLYYIKEKHCFPKDVKLKLKMNKIVKLWRCSLRKFIFCKLIVYILQK